MKKLPTIFFMVFISYTTIAQVGIGTTSPDDSSILDVYSNDKGILIPRITTSNRDAIVNPSNGLLLYNSTTKSFNYFDTVWRDFSPSYASTNSSEAISTTSVTNVDIPQMVLLPSQGTHSIFFDSQISNTSAVPGVIVNSDELVIDFFALYNQLQAFTTTNSIHLAAYGSGETLTPGKYTNSSATSIAGILNLDGQGDPNAIFIFYATGDINFDASTTVVLSNGAASENIFWLGEGAVGVGANSIIYGNLIAQGAAIAVGTSCSLTGRMLTNAGTVSFGPGVCSVPSNTSSIIDMGSTQTFVVFTGAGAINNTGSSVYNGNICSAGGATDSLSVATVNGVIVPPSADTVINSDVNASATATFSLYQNDILIPSSSKQITCNSGYTNLSLSAIATVLSGQSITIKWKIDSGTLTLGNRVFTAIKVH